MLIGHFPYMVKPLLIPMKQHIHNTVNVSIQAFSNYLSYEIGKY